MPFVVKDRVRETTTTTGTGTVTLAGAVTGFQSFSVIGNTNTTYYTIVDNTAGTWEVGVGTYTSVGTTLSRDAVLESSNSGSLVNFAAGTKDVFCAYPAEGSTLGFTSTATAAGTTTLTSASSYIQLFTGTSAQTVQLPSTATLSQGWSFHVVNNSTGTLTVQTSTAVSLGTIPPGVSMMPTVISTAGNTAADWEVGYTDFSTIRGTGSVVLINPLVSSTTSITSPLAWSSDSFDVYAATAQAGNFTINADAGTPADGRKAIFRIASDATPRVVTFTGGASKAFKPVGVTLTTSGSNFTYTLTASKITYFGCIYNANSDRWEIVALSQEA